MAPDRWHVGRLSRLSRPRPRGGLDSISSPPHTKNSTKKCQGDTRNPLTLMMMTVMMTMMNCMKCGHVWVSVVPKPLKCPACNQPKYWLPKVRNVVEGISEAVRVDSPKAGRSRKGSRRVAGVGVLEGSSSVSGQGEPKGSDHDVSPESSSACPHGQVSARVCKIMKGGCE